MVPHSLPHCNTLAISPRTTLHHTFLPTTICPRQWSIRPRIRRCPLCPRLARLDDGHKSYNHSVSLRVRHPASRHVSQCKHALCRAGIHPHIPLYLLFNGPGAYSLSFASAEAILILDSTEHPVEVFILAQLRGTLVHLAVSPTIRRTQMVLPGRALLLAATSPCHQPRKAKKRLWANVSPPLCDEFLDVRRIRLSLDQRRQCDSLHHGRG